MEKLQAIHTVPFIPQTQIAQILLQMIPPAWVPTQIPDDPTKVKLH